MSTAERNRLIKKGLQAVYGRDNVTVKGGRGTAYGWVHVKISAPVAGEYYSDKKAAVMKIVNATGAKIGTYGYDDPGSDYGFGSEILFELEEPQPRAA
jgi:hypothetical protein